jgi:hypothetical protein
MAKVKVRGRRMHHNTHKMKTMTRSINFNNAMQSVAKMQIYIMVFLI